ncbi:hypothetical protein C8A00DRAFT_38260 [Chaetomidium leptoderma]|uniref:DUF6604 domain-containing protein n=1 Tax=Chaetomidium leptoderma TaxID=669021 RepID=A0AAN6ZT60_9PEZI|nr:hypothetical protein C8A00DRAFT_38260 [Chaetomidium leptoderma]
MASHTSLYKRYKLLTQYITSWLASAGAACHCPSSLLEPPGPSNQSTPTRRYHYTIKITSFVPLAEWIERATPAVHVPRSILVELDNVIKLRIKYGGMLRGSREPTADDLGHLHFIDVLQNLRMVLNRLPLAISNTQASASTKSATPPSRFGPLDVTEIPDESDTDDERQTQFIAPVGNLLEITDTAPTIEEGVFQFRLLLEAFRPLKETTKAQWTGTARTASPRYGLHRHQHRNPSRENLEIEAAIVYCKTSVVGELSMLPLPQSRETLRPAQLHLAEMQGDVFRKFKSATKNAGVVSATPYFTLSRHPVLCGLLLHVERVLAQNAALRLESDLGGLNAAVHLGNAFTNQGYTQDLGALQSTARQQGDKSFFLGGKRPTTNFLAAFGLSIGMSLSNQTKDARKRCGDDDQLAVRKKKLELAAPAPFSRLVDARLQDTMGRFSLTESELTAAILEAGYTRRPAAQTPPPLQHAATLLHAVVPVLEHDYLSSIRVAWEALRAVQAVLLGVPVVEEGPGESRSRGRRRGGQAGTRKQEERMVNSAECIVGRVFGASGNEALMRRLARAYAGAVSARYLGDE